MILDNSAAQEHDAREQQAAQALGDLRAYLALQNPTNAQTIAAVRLLCRVAINLIKFAYNRE